MPSRGRIPHQKRPSRGVEEMSPQEALDALRTSVKWCPVHHQTDCSPLLNGCPRLARQADAIETLQGLISRQPDEKHHRKWGWGSD